MTNARKSAFAAALALAALGLGAPRASAMPLGLEPAIATSAPGAQIDAVRWVCGPYRCFWRPNYVYVPAPYWRPYYGWRRW